MDTGFERSLTSTRLLTFRLNVESNVSILSEVQDIYFLCYIIMVRLSIIEVEIGPSEIIENVDHALGNVRVVTCALLACLIASVSEL